MRSRQVAEKSAIRPNDPERAASEFSTRTASDYGIALYEDPTDPTAKTVIWAPAIANDVAGADGFQIVMLRRSDLSVQMNKSIENFNFGQGFDGDPLVDELSAPPPAGCGQVGCLVIIQSLQTIGYTRVKYGTTSSPLFCRSGGIERSSGGVTKTPCCPVCNQSDTL